MNWASIKKNDIANGPGVRITLFVSGCTHYCKNCFNQEAWDFNYGKPFDGETEDMLIDMMSPPFVRGLTLLGGEPFEPANQRGLLPFLKRIKAIYPEKDIWCFTGYTLEKDLLNESRARCEATDEMLSLIDVLVDGEFVEELHDISLRFRGSSNQRLIDLKKTLKTGSVVLWGDK